jgi:hypothetical protein
VILEERTPPSRFLLRGRFSKVLGALSLRRGSPGPAVARGALPFLERGLGGHARSSPGEKRRRAERSDAGRGPLGARAPGDFAPRGPGCWTPTRSERPSPAVARILFALWPVVAKARVFAKCGQFEACAQHVRLWTGPGAITALDAGGEAGGAALLRAQMRGDLGVGAWRC